MPRTKAAAKKRGRPATKKKAAVKKAPARRGRPPMKKSAVKKAPARRGRPATKKKAAAKKSTVTADLRAKISAAKAEAREAKATAKAEVAAIKAELAAATKREAALVKMIDSRDKAVAAYTAKWDKAAMKKVAKATAPKKKRRARKAK